MPQVTLPVDPVGLLLGVVIGMDAGELASLLASGQPIPAPIFGRGLIDTGTDVTAVTPQVIGQLGLQSAGKGMSQTTGGQIPVNLFRASLSLRGPAGTLLALPDTVVVELSAPLTDAEV